MPFEFMGADLETEQGRSDYVDFYDVSRGIENNDLLLPYTENGTYTRWAEENPEASEDFLRFCTSHDSPLVRELAIEISLDWVNSNPDLVTEILIGGLEDKDRTVKSKALSLVKDLITVYDYDEAVQSLELSRLAKIARTYKQASVPIRPSIGTVGPETESDNS